MRRFYIDPEQLGKTDPRITGRQVGHIRNVLRLSEGEAIRLVDGTGRVFEAHICGFEKDAVRVTVIRQTEERSESGTELIVAQGFLKENKMDDLVRQLTELGVTRWIPMITERTVARPDAKRLQKRLNRWQSIAVEAIKQCGRNTVPEITSAIEFSEVLELADTVELPIFFWENANSPVYVNSDTRPASVLLMLGPEGGFTEHEADQAKKRGLRFATMGPRILRAETAAVAACSLAQYLFGDLQKSP
ncbi:MAG: 16S rRNA (uracil(1498)-N(3))-methyltransferase [Desulfobacteraceae bacterium]|nr:16S rRNA (uracil(1498)-N(3))-methyltransferase [Desulfobacteraceae bacterium]